MRPRPGDRKRRWQSTCQIEGGIGLFLGSFFAFAALSNEGKTEGTVILLCFAALIIYLSVGSFVSAKRGWKIRYDLPPKYYRDIKSSNPITREVAREAAKRTLKEARNPNRKKYAFEKKS